MGKKFRRTGRKERGNIFLSSIALFLVLILITAGFSSCKNNYTENVGTSASTAETKTDDETVTEDEKYPFEVDFIDVGQGDCELITCRGTSILIDGGEYDSYGKVSSFLKDKGVKDIDLYIMSHPHTDHIGCTSKILGDYEVGTFFSTALSEINTPTTYTYERTLNAIENCSAEYVEVKAGDVFTFGELTVNILSPDGDYEELNDMSIVCTISYGEVTALFGGDATGVTESRLLEKETDISADIYKVAHHGSETSNSYDFVAAVNPSVAVISCGVGNTYGHPNILTINTLDKLGIRYYRTDRNGNISVYSDGKEIITETQK